MTLTFFVAGKAAPGGSKKAFPIFKGPKGNKVFTGRVAVVDAAGQANKDWRANVVQAAFEAMQKANLAPFQGPVKLELKFIMPRPKDHYRSNGEIKASAPDWHTKMPDVGKLARSTTDALKGICFRDDAQVSDDHHTKKYGDIIGCAVQIFELTT